MLVAVLGDMHFGARGDSPVFHNYFKKFYSEVFFKYLEDMGIEHVIQLGDVFDRRKYVNFNTLKQSKEYFFEPLNSKYKTWMLIGNHDTFYKNTVSVNSPSLLLDSFKNIHCITSPFETSFNGLSILFVPWICDENYHEVMEAIKKSKSPILVGHFEINGFEMYKGSFCDEGLDTSLFDKFELVISGHFHTRSSKGNVTYTGTPYELTWSDYDDPKGFHVLDTTTRELHFVPNPFNMFHKIWYDDSSSSMDEVLGINFDKYKDTFVKVIITNKLNTTWYDLFIEKLEKAGCIDMQVVEDHLNLNLEDDKDIISQAEDTITILNKYIAQLELKTDKNKLEDLFRELYSDAISLE